MNESSGWQRYIWIGASVGLLLMIFGLFIFVSFMLEDLMTLIANQKQPDLAFIFASTGFVTLTSLRLIAILIGATIAFAGLAVSFFANEKASKIGAEAASNSSANLNVSLATYSPGIVGMVIGSIIIIFALYAKSSQNYEGPKTYQLTVGDSVQSQPDSLPEQTRLRSLEELIKEKNTSP